MQGLWGQGVARKPVRGYPAVRVRPAILPRMIGLSVALGRFVEALFWAILRVAGMVGGAGLLAGMALGGLWWSIRRRRR